MNLYEKFIQVIKPTWELTEPFPRYQDRDEESFRVLHLNQSEFEFLKNHFRKDLSSIEWLTKIADEDPHTPSFWKYLQKNKKTLSEIQRKLKNESRP